LDGKFKGKGVEALGKIANVLEEIVVGDQGRDGSEESGGGGDEGFGNAGSDGAEAGGAGSAEAGKCVNDAPNGTEQTDKGGDARGRGEPGHPLFHTTNFLGGSELHRDGNSLHRLELLRSGVAGAGELALEFTIACGIDGRERRTCGDKTLWIGDAFSGAENFQELVAFATDTAEKTRLLEDESPGNEREEEKKGENEAGNPASLRKNFKDIADEDGGEQRDDVNPSKRNRILVT